MPCPSRRLAPAGVLVLVLTMACGPGPAPVAPAPPPDKVVQVNATGAPVDLASILVPDHVTVVDFWATWCGGCAVVDAKLTAAIADVPAVVVRKIDIGDGDTAVARQHKVGALPHVRIYDRAGNLRYVLAGNDALTAGDAALTLAAE
jgi:thiol:disulfide interchange protein